MNRTMSLGRVISIYNLTNIIADVIAGRYFSYHNQAIVQIKIKVDSYHNPGHFQFGVLSGSQLDATSPGVFAASYGAVLLY